MSDTLLPVAILLVFGSGWFVLNKWVLPRFGVAT